ncbi:MAG: anthranilate phosphoribosyltransferase, partial [Sphingomonadales bacterium]
LSIEAPPGAVDTCGTGGDALGTFNISTTAAIITAAAGVPVAKHGNRAVSSKAGSADVLQALGVNLEAPIEVVQQALDRLGITFLFAARHHSAMRHVAAARGELGFRSIFNLVGPLANPAGVKRQVLGVFSKEWVEPMAHVLKSLKLEKAWVVHGAGGMDEISTLGPTFVAELDGGRVTTFEVTPEDGGFEPTSLGQIKGGGRLKNSRIIRAIVDGANGPMTDIALINAAAALVVAGKAKTLKDGAALARTAITSGKARTLLADWVRLSNRA